MLVILTDPHKAAQPTLGIVFEPSAVQHDDIIELFVGAGPLRNSVIPLTYQSGSGMVST